MTDGVEVLSVHGLTVAFGGVKALDDVTFTLTSPRISAVIGPNGAGKSTLFNCISGFQRPSEGDVRRLSQSLVGLGPTRVAGLGVARTFQNLALVPSASVGENVLLGRHRHGSSGLIRGMIRDPWTRREERLQYEQVQETVHDCGLDSVVDTPVQSLPYGIRKKVELARALVQEPTLLLLDEPMAGMSNQEKGELSELIVRVVDERGLSVVMVEHDMNVIMDLAEEIVVLDFGRLIAHGPPQSIRNDPAVIEAYLGAEFRDEDEVVAEHPTPERIADVAG